MKIQEYLAEQVEKIEAALDQYLPAATTKPSNLHESMRYSTLAGGKRLRAILAMEACVAVGGKAEDALSFACALEMIHAYTLIHDDLPCMDDDDFRRGKPTNHKVYGEAIALLAGDALLTKAMEVIAGLVDQGLDAKVVVKIIKEVTTACGSEGLIGGQVVDLMSEGKKIDQAELEYIHRNKTGKLFLAALRGGAIIGGADEQQLELITCYGENFGLAFQITDDILDVVGDAEKLGKAVGSDLRQEKSTYVSIFGLEEAKIQAKRYIDLCSQAAQKLTPDRSALANIAQYVLVRDY